MNAKDLIYATFKYTDARNLENKGMNEEVMVGFYAGANYADDLWREKTRWIPVDELLPAEWELVNVKIFLKLHSGCESHQCSMGYVSGKTWNILHSLIENYYHCKAWTVIAWKYLE